MICIYIPTENYIVIILDYDYCFKRVLVLDQDDCHYLFFEKLWSAAEYNHNIIGFPFRASSNMTVL